MAFYGDAETAEKLAGVVAGTATTEQQSVINDWINANIKWNGFVESLDVVEYYDIRKTDQSELVLKNFPIISLTEIIDDSISNPETLTTDDYVVDKESGIVQLLKRCFKKGFNSVKVTYKYGFVTVPDIIKQIANLMLAKWLKILAANSNTGDGENIKSVKIGDYTETYDLEFMNIKSEFDGLLIPMIKRAEEYYADGV